MLGAAAALLGIRRPAERPPKPPPKPPTLWIGHI
jgi:hypothetical protein